MKTELQSMLDESISVYFFPCSNDEVEEGEPGEDSDFEVDAKKEV